MEDERTPITSLLLGLGGMELIWVEALPQLATIINLN